VYSGFWFNWVAGKALRGFIRKSLGGLIPGTRGGARRHARKNLAVFLALLAFLILSAWSWPLTAQAQSYYYTGKNPMVPAVNDAASAIPCDASALGAIRYNTGTAAFEGCNGIDGVIEKLARGDGVRNPNG